MSNIPYVIANPEGVKQPNIKENYFASMLDCFVAALLAMTVRYNYSMQKILTLALALILATQSGIVAAKEPGLCERGMKFIGLDIRKRQIHLRFAAVLATLAGGSLTAYINSGAEVGFEFTKEEMELLNRDISDWTVEDFEKHSLQLAKMQRRYVQAYQSHAFKDQHRNYWAEYTVGALLDFDYQRDELRPEHVADEYALELAKLLKKHNLSDSRGEFYSTYFPHLKAFENMPDEKIDQVMADAMTLNVWDASAIQNETSLAKILNPNRQGPLTLDKVYQALFRKVQVPFALPSKQSVRRKEIMDLIKPAKK